ncbi:hypothetical protein ABRP93_11215 [Corynebacterium sp. KPL2850]|uniref:hypothetical protein n=1 Tax=Corynebacterium sp. KPL2850 TaxID=3158318 RepID=UPI0032EC2DB4
MTAPKTATGLSAASVHPTCPYHVDKSTARSHTVGMAIDRPPQRRGAEDIG